MSGKEPDYPQITTSTIHKLGILTTKEINERQDELKKITWNDGESNLDTEYSKLACYCCTVSWDEIKKNYPEFSKIKIKCFPPDINITFEYPSGTKSKDKIELKSSKSRKMPGSTIKKLDINQTLIYCLRPSMASDPYIVRCSQYHNAMGESDTDLFQDRTPRPFINFEKMSHADNIVPFIVKDKNEFWEEHYANCALNRIKDTKRCKKSWQDVLVKIMKKKIIDDYIRNTSEEQFKKDKSFLDS